MIDVKEILDNFTLALEYPTRREALEDWRFTSGGSQWDPRFKQLRLADNLPALEMNRLPQFVRLAANAMREQPIDIKALPMGDGAGKEAARWRSAKIRAIQEKSNAADAYQTAAYAAACGGYGWVKVYSDYTGPRSFEQEIRVAKMLDWDAVLCDPGAMDPTASDARWQIELTPVPKKDYERTYGAAAPSSKFEREQMAWNYTGAEHCVTLATYWYRVDKPAWLVRLVSGEIVVAPSRTAVERDLVEEMRPTVIPAVKWAKTNGVEILEHGDFASDQYMPFVRFSAEHFMLDGRQYLVGVTRYAKDSQSALNYTWSKQVETIGLAPKAPIIAAAGQLEGHEKMWSTSHIRAYPVLLYNPKSIDGTVVPEPHRLQYHTDIQALSMATAQAQDGLKSTTGFYDSALGARSNETSGIAISQRGAQTERSNYHLYANAKLAVKQVGYLINDMIPKVYSGPRVESFTWEDDRTEMVPVNQPYQEDGEEKVIDLTKGEFDVSITAGRAFADRREEAMSGLMALVQTAPQAFPLIGDVIAENLPIPGAHKIAQRLRTLLPPEAQDGDQKIPPAVAKHMREQGEMIAQLTQAVNTLQTEKDFKLKELESREKIESMKIEADLAKTEAQLGASAAIEALRADVNRIQADLSREHEMRMANAGPATAGTPEGGGMNG